MILKLHSLMWQARKAKVPRKQRKQHLSRQHLRRKQMLLLKVQPHPLDMVFRHLLQAVCQHWIQLHSLMRLVWQHLRRKPLVQQRGSLMHLVRLHLQGQQMLLLKVQPRLLEIMFRHLLQAAFQQLHRLKRLVRQCLRQKQMLWLQGSLMCRNQVFQVRLHPHLRAQVLQQLPRLKLCLAKVQRLSLVRVKAQL